MKIKFAIILTILIFYFSNYFYKKTNIIDYPNKIDVIVNKDNKLNKYYRPYDLVKINEKFANKDKYLRKEACYFFELMSNDAKLEGYNITAISTYRSYFYQKELFNHYVKKMGKDKALISVAKEGYSEHQTGLALDIMGSNGDYNKFEQSREFNWVIKNAYKYGFILRYPKDKEHITGFKYEPWHYRYVGVDIAKVIYLNNLTLEEYKKVHK